MDWQSIVYIAWPLHGLLILWMTLETNKTLARPQVRERLWLFAIVLTLSIMLARCWPMNDYKKHKLLRHIVPWSEETQEYVQWMVSAVLPWCFERRFLKRMAILGGYVTLHMLIHLYANISVQTFSELMVFSLNIHHSTGEIGIGIDHDSVRSGGK